MPAFVSSSLQIVLACLGGLLFALLNVPAAWLSGSVVATALWNLSRWSRPMPQPLVQMALLLSGVSMGAGVTPEAMSALRQYPISILLLLTGIVCITWISMLWLMHFGKWQRDDAFLASVPGALSAVIATAVDRGNDVERIILVQLLRLAVLILLLPSLIALVGEKSDITFFVGEGLAVVDVAGFAAMLCGGLIIGQGFKLLKLAAPVLLGGMAMSTLLHATGLTEGVVPPHIATFGLVLIGAFIGERFRGITREMLRTVLPTAFGALSCGLVLTYVFAQLAAMIAHVGVADAMVAFAPGGLEAMMALALVLGLDPLYVGLHHLIRFLSIGFSLPIVVKWMGRR